MARAQLNEAKNRWNFYPPIIDELKEKAKKLGLWNMFLSKHAYAEGFELTNLEYGLIAMILGRSGLASEVSLSEPEGVLLHVLMGLRVRLSTVLLQTQATWKLSPNTAIHSRRRSG